MADEFVGLEEGVDRYQLLLLVKKVGKLAGFTPRMIQLLDYYFAFTRDCDWEEGSRPIVYQSLSRTALDLGVTERQIQKLEAALFTAGAIGWHDSGNHRRYGHRCPQTGRIRFAFGVDLTPLAYLKPTLEAKLHEKQLHDEAWLATKREISWHRRQIRALLAEWKREEGASSAEVFSIEQNYTEISVQLRTHIDLATLRTLLVRHQSLLRAIEQAMGVGDATTEEGTQRPSMPQITAKGSSRSEPKFTHYQSTNQQSSKDRSPRDACLQESVADRSEHPGAATNSGIAHVTLKMALAAASERFTAHLPTNPEWDDLVEAAYKLRQHLGISQASWAKACQLMGRNGAALCLLITDQAALRKTNPVRQPAAYFHHLQTRAEARELHLHASIFGLLQKQRLLVA